MLKEYVKELTGRSPRNTAGVSHLTVKCNGDQNQNRIFEESNLYISPKYTKLEKKIAEWRESKFYRAYGKQQILFEKDNQGYELTTTSKV